MAEARRSALDRLLETLSWDGSAIKKYREGGAGQENVLTTEVFAALDFLPRSFLGLVLTCAHGDATVLQFVADDAEDAVLTVLGEDLYLRPSGDGHGQRMTLQPDAVIEMPGTYVLVEAKRIRQPATFGVDQLARSLAVATTQAGPDRRALVLVVMGCPPPIAVRGVPDRCTIEESIARHLPRIAKDSDYDLDAVALLARVDQSVAWITWDEIATLAQQHLSSFASVPPDVRTSIARLVESVVNAVERHREPDPPQRPPHTSR